MPADGGLSLTALFREKIDDRRAVDSLAGIGIAARPLSSFYRIGAAQAGLVLSFAGWSAAEMEQAVARMARETAWKRSG